GLEPVGAIDAELRARAGAGLVEAISRDGLGERRQRAAVIHRGLRTLGLDLVENPGELRHLRFLQLQLVSEEPERPAHSEGAAAEPELARLFFAGRRIRKAAMPAFAVARADAAFAAAASPTGNESRIHETSPRRGDRSRRVHDAWAKCLTRNSRLRLPSGGRQPEGGTSSADSASVGFRTRSLWASTAANTMPSWK